MDREPRQPSRADHEVLEKLSRLAMTELQAGAEAAQLSATTERLPIRKSMNS